MDLVWSFIVEEVRTVIKDLNRQSASGADKHNDHVGGLNKWKLWSKSIDPTSFLQQNVKGQLESGIYRPSHCQTTFTSVGKGTGKLLKAHDCKLVTSFQ